MNILSRCSLWFFLKSWSLCFVPIAYGGVMEFIKSVYLNMWQYVRYWIRRRIRILYNSSWNWDLKIIWFFDRFIHSYLPMGRCEHTHSHTKLIFMMQLCNVSVEVYVPNTPLTVLLLIDEFNWVHIFAYCVLLEFALTKHAHPRTFPLLTGWIIEHLLEICI